MLAFAAVLVAARNPLNTNAAALPEPPAFTFSGVIGASQQTHDSYLRPSVGHNTLVSAITSSPASEVLGLRAASAIEPASSFSAGVAAAGGGMASLADRIDPLDPYFFYVTRPGDTLSIIAQAYGLSVDTILDNNPTVTDANEIELDRKLLIPRTEGILHEVARGETLTAIIDQYDDVTEDAVTEFSPNKISSDDDLPSGQYVLLPGATFKPPPPPPVQPANPATGRPAPAQGHGLFDYPLGNGVWTTVSDPFGTWRGPGRIHTGIDLAGFNAAPVYSACDGIVIKVAWWTYSYGYHVIVNCGDGWTTLYAHFRDIVVVEGQYVASGTHIGVTGSTGYSTGEHLHFEIRLNGAYYDPASYLPNFY